MINKFFKKNENPYFSKIKKTLKGYKKISQIYRIYFVSAYLYSDENLLMIKQGFSTENIDLTKSLQTFNSDMDAVEIYGLEYKNGSKEILLVRDPVELYEPEEIIHSYSISKSFWNSIEKEQIFPD